MRGIVLFDIDNTLLYSGGAGSAAMYRAFEDVYGLRVEGERIEFDGRTDRAIFRDMLRRFGLDVAEEDGRFARFLDTYLRTLDATLTEKRGHLKPGIPDLLDALADAGLVLGLATGNLRAGAERKLRHFGLSEYFRTGGFGDGVFERALLVREALSALGRDDGVPVWVVGDTPADIESARANDVFAVGVATGAHPIGRLREAGADLALDDLSAIDEVIAALLSLTAVVS